MLEKNDPFHYQVQFAPPPNAQTPLPYSYRSTIAPYSTHYEFGNKPSAMAWGALDPSTAGIMSPFRSAVATGGNHSSRCCCRRNVIRHFYYSRVFH